MIGGEPHSSLHSDNIVPDYKNHKDIYTTMLLLALEVA